MSEVLNPSIDLAGTDFKISPMEISLDYYGAYEPGIDYSTSPEQAVQPVVAEVIPAENEGMLDIDPDVEGRVDEVVLADRAARESRWAVSELGRMKAEAAQQHSQKMAELEKKIAKLEQANNDIALKAEGRNQNRRSLEITTQQRQQTIEALKRRRADIETKLLEMRDEMRQIEAEEADLMASSIDSAATDILQKTQNSSTEAADSLLAVLDARSSDLEKVSTTEQVCLDSFNSEFNTQSRSDDRQQRINATEITDSDRLKAREQMAYDSVIDQYQETITDIKDNYTPKLDDLRQKMIDGTRIVLEKRSNIDRQTSELEKLDAISEDIAQKEEQLRTDIPLLKEKLEARKVSLKESYEYLVRNWSTYSQDLQNQYAQGRDYPLEVQPHEDEECMLAQSDYDRAVHQLDDAKRAAKKIYISMGAEESKLTIMKEDYADYIKEHILPIYEEVKLLHMNLRNKLSRVGVTIPELAVEEKAENPETEEDDTVSLRAVVDLGDVLSVQNSITNQAG